jgi:hypothetical protein
MSPTAAAGTPPAQPPVPPARASDEAVPAAHRRLGRARSARRRGRGHRGPRRFRAGRLTPRHARADLFFSSTNSTPRGGGAPALDLDEPPPPRGKASHPPYLGLRGCHPPTWRHLGNTWAPGLEPRPGEHLGPRPGAQAWGTPGAQAWGTPGAQAYARVGPPSGPPPPFTPGFGFFASFAAFMDLTTLSGPAPLHPFPPFSSIFAAFVAFMDLTTLSGPAPPPSHTRVRALLPLLSV